MKAKGKKPLITTLSRAPSSSKKIEDQSHLRKPIETSIFGLRQVISLLETSTQEVQDYISYECDILYECRICRTIFRSLANFILHKRNYCTEKFANVDNVRTKTSVKSNKEVLSEDIETITLTSDSSRSPSPEIQLKDRPPSPRINFKSHDAGKIENKPERGGIARVIDKLVDRNKVKELAQKALKEDLSAVVKKKPEKRAENPNVKLEPIPTNEAAVFQTMFKSLVEESKPEFMRSEVMELHGLFDSDEAVLGRDGKICTFKTNKVNEKPNIPKNTLVCTECDLKFATKKTLAYHIKYKHNVSQIVYPCPVCKDTFANVWCVYRHLLKIHRKTSSQIRKLRETIHNSSILKRDLQSTSMTKKDRKSNEKATDDENQWLKNLEGDNDIQMCGGCGKRFERKAALYSHSQMCLKRAAVCNTIKEKNRKGQEDKDKVKTVKADKQPVTETISGSRKRKPQIVITYKNIAGKKSHDKSNPPGSPSTPRDESKKPDGDLAGPSIEDNLVATKLCNNSKGDDERVAMEPVPVPEPEMQNCANTNTDNTEVVITKISSSAYREESTDTEKNDSFDTDDDPVYQQSDSYIPLDNLDKESMMSILGISMNPVTIFQCASPNNKNPAEDEGLEEEFGKRSRSFLKQNKEETCKASLSAEEKNENSSDGTHLERAIFETVNIENCKSFDDTSTSTSTGAGGASGSEDPFFGFSHSSIDYKECFEGESSESPNRPESNSPEPEPVPHSFDLVLMKDSTVDECVNTSPDKSASNSPSDTSSGICENNEETSNDGTLTGVKLTTADPAIVPRNKNFCGIETISEDVPSLEIDPLLIEGDEGIGSLAGIPNEYQKLVIFSNKTEGTAEREVNSIHVSSTDSGMEVKKLDSSDFIKMNDYNGYMDDEVNVQRGTDESILDESIIVKLPNKSKSSKRRHTYSLGSGDSPAKTKKSRPSKECDDEHDEEKFSVLARQYMDRSALECMSCDKRYSSDSHLLEHMALHFSWFRFQCSHCTFMSFGKSNCEKHATKVHNASFNSLSNIVLSIPSWKTMLISHAFQPIEDKEDRLNINGSAETISSSIAGDNGSFHQAGNDCFQEVETANDTLEIDTVNTKDNYKIDMSDITDNFLLFKDEELYSRSLIDKPTAMNCDNESILEILCTEEESKEMSSSKDKKVIDHENIKPEPPILTPIREGDSPGLPEKLADCLPEDEPVEAKKIDPVRKVKSQKKLQNSPRPIRKRIKSSKTSQSDFLYDLDTAVKLKTCVIRKKTSSTAKLLKSPKKPGAHGAVDLKPLSSRMKQGDASVPVTGPVPDPLILDSQKGEKKTNN